MQIITNPGSNLMPEVVQHYGIHLAPQRIVVDSVDHDTREPISHEEVDAWIARAKTFPYVVGTTAHEMSALFTEVGKSDPEILCVMTSRKIIQSHAAAVSASRALAAHHASQHLRISVVDSMMSDAITGAFTIMAAEAAQRGHSLNAITKLLETVAPSTRLAIVPATLDNLVKGGRATWTRAFLADILKMRPMIAMRNGELEKHSMVSIKDDRAAAIVKYLEREVGTGRRVWAMLAHGSVDTFELAAALGHLRRVFKVEYVYARPLSSSIYLHLGRGALAIGVAPVDDLPWSPAIPPPFSMGPGIG